MVSMADMRERFRLLMNVVDVGRAGRLPEGPAVRPRPVAAAPEPQGFGRVLAARRRLAPHLHDHLRRS